MTIPELHSLFLSLGGLAMPLASLHRDYFIESSWMEWQRRFTVEDLKLVLRYKKDMIRTRNINIATLSFRNTIADCSRFGEWLVEARAHYRSNPQLTNKQKILKETHRSFHVYQKPRKVSEIDWRLGIAELKRTVDAIPPAM